MYRIQMMELSGLILANPNAFLIWLTAVELVIKKKSTEVAFKGNFFSVCSFDKKWERK